MIRKFIRDIGKNRMILLLQSCNYFIFRKKYFDKIFGVPLRKGKFDLFFSNIKIIVNSY